MKKKKIYVRIYIYIRIYRFTRFVVEISTFEMEAWASKKKATRMCNTRILLNRANGDSCYNEGRLFQEYYVFRDIQVKREGSKL